MEREQEQWRGSWIIFFPTQTTVTVVGSLPPRRSEWKCVVKNLDTGRELCRGRSPPGRVCTCNMPTRATYKGKWTLLFFCLKVRKAREPPEFRLPRKQVECQGIYIFPPFRLAVCLPPALPSVLLTSALPHPMIPGSHSDVWLENDRAGYAG